MGSTTSTDRNPKSMELTCMNKTPSCSDMDLTAPGSSSIHVRKRPLEAEEEELELPEEVQPLATSTPNVSSYIVPDMLVVYIAT